MDADRGRDEERARMVLASLTGHQMYWHPQNIRMLAEALAAARAAGEAVGLPPDPDALRVLRDLTSNAVSMAMILFCEREHPGHCAAMLEDPDKRQNWDVLQRDWHEAIKDARAYLAEHDPDGEPLGLAPTAGDGAGATPGEGQQS